MEPHEKKSIFHSSPPVEPWLCYYYQCFITISPAGDKSHCGAGTQWSQWCREPSGPQSGSLTGVNTVNSVSAEEHILANFVLKMNKTKYLVALNLARS